MDSVCKNKFYSYTVRISIMVTGGVVTIVAIVRLKNAKAQFDKDAKPIQTFGRTQPKRGKGKRRWFCECKVQELSLWHIQRDED